MLVLLESLSPEQRAVLLLHEVFDYGYRESRRSSARARTTCARSTPATDATSSSAGPLPEVSEQRDELARRFFAAAEQGDLAGLEALLAHDVELTGDGGDKVPAFARSLRGPTVSRTLINYWGRVARRSGMSLRPVEVNGGPGALVLDPQQRLIGVVRSISPAARSPASAGSSTPTG